MGPNTSAYRQAADNEEKDHPMRFDRATLCLAPLRLGACATPPRMAPAVSLEVSGLQQCNLARFAAALPADAAITSVPPGTAPVAHCRVRGTYAHLTALVPGDENHFLIGA